MNLVELPVGTSARVVSIEGGYGVLKRLQNLGIREGVTVTKVVGLFTHGPIVVRSGSVEVALGKGMAAKVSVKPL